MDDEAWDCKMCVKSFTDPEARLLECQRCKDYFCIDCLNKTKAEYEMLAKSDTMWFCVQCRKVVEEHIVIDLKIEERCREIMNSYESRITKLERQMEETCREERVREIVTEEISTRKCDEASVRGIVREELELSDTTGAVARLDSASSVAKANGNKEQDGQKDKTVTNVIEEIKERKDRENNLVIFGMDEYESDVKEARAQEDTRKTIELFTDCKIQIEDKIIKGVKRLGRYNKDEQKPSRPLLVQLEQVEYKLRLFKNIHYMKNNPKYTKVSVSNDLTRTERQNEKALWEEAQRRNKEETSGDYIHKTRGPPWARKVVRVKKE